MFADGDGFGDILLHHEFLQGNVVIQELPHGDTEGATPERRPAMSHI